ncbi:MAG: 2OG-Fe(II) oxygenase [Alphaproteobacteria bacterium]
MFVRVQGLLAEEAAGTLSSAVEKLGAASESVDGQPQPVNLDAHEQHRKLGDAVVRGLTDSAPIASRFFPKAIGRPLFWRMQAGSEHGWHTDPAIANGERPFRTDVTALVFLSPLDSYEGGAVLVQEFGNATRFKLPAGDALLFPSHLIRAVEKVESGTRIAASVAMQSLIRDPVQRQILVDVDQARQNAIAKDAGAEEAVLLMRAHSNLVRLWAEL